MLISLLTVLATSLPAAPQPVVLLEWTPIVQDEVEDKREEIKELVDKLKGHIGKRGDQDTEAIGVIDQLNQEFPESGPKDRAAIIKQLGKCFDVKRQPLSPGVANNRLFLATAICLGEMGPEASKTLLKYVGHKKHRKDITLQRALILSVGKTKDKSAVKSILGLLNDKDNTIIASAAESLANYSEIELKTRKDIFNDLLKILTTAKAVKDGDLNDIFAREKFDAIAGPITTTLQELSGHDARKPEAWQRWWNKNKKKDWDEAED